MPFIIVDKTLRQVVSTTQTAPNLNGSDYCAIEVGSLDGYKVRHQVQQAKTLDPISGSALIAWEWVDGTVFTSAELDALLAKQTEKSAAATASVAGYEALPDVLRTMTATDAETYINTQIWNSMTTAQVNAWIDTSITGTTVAQVRDQVIVALKALAGAVITTRGLFVLVVKLEIYIRDLVIRFR